jgi:two-component system, OmpR family, sensor histidine kinase MtrB
MTLVAISGVAVVGAIVAGLERRRLVRRRHAIAELLHEMRGALAAIELGASALERRLAGRDASTRLDAFRMQVERAEAATRDLAALHACRTRRSHEAVSAPVEIGKLVRRRAAAWDRLAVMPGGRVELHWPLGPTLVRAPSERICRALDNLIANALEHGGGRVRVEGALEGSLLQITVSDRGPGLGRGLERHRSAPWNALHGHGLTIARRAVERSGGRLRSITQSGGAAIEIELPLHAAADRSQENGVAPLQPQIAAEARVS